MIHIIEGRIGSGKTYWCVSYVLRLYYDWDNRFFEFFPKKDIPKIITNIKSLSFGEVIDLNALLDAAGSLEDLFYINPVTYELKHKVFENSVLIIDEAQSPRFFHRLYKGPGVMLFFQLHRHFGAEVFLATQDVKTLCPDLRELPEYHLRCVRQSLQLGKFFTYRKYYDTEPGATSRLRRDQRVFDCYKSVESGVTHKNVPSALTRYVVILAVGICLFVLGGYGMKAYFFGTRSQAVASPSKPVVSPSVVPAASPVLNKYPIYSSPSAGDFVPSDKAIESELIKNIKDLGFLRVELITSGRVLRKYDYEGVEYTFLNNKMVHKTLSQASARSDVYEGASRSPVGYAGDLVKNTNNSNTDHKNNIRQ